MNTRKAPLLRILPALAMLALVACSILPPMRAAELTAQFSGNNPAAGVEYIAEIRPDGAPTWALAQAQAIAAEPARGPGDRALRLTGLQPATTYTVRIRARYIGVTGTDGNGVSPPSDPATATTLYDPLNAPTGVILIAFRVHIDSAGRPHLLPTA